MTYNIYQFEGTNLWNCISSIEPIMRNATRRQCIEACIIDALEQKTSCTIISEIIRP